MKKKPIQHRMTGTRFYGIWRNMEKRCFYKKNHNYHVYGGRGITIEWKDFLEFKKDMYRKYLNAFKKNPKIELDRINVEGNYSKNNCRWISHKENCQNIRANKLIYYKGRTKGTTYWASYLQIKRSTLMARIYRDKWSVKRAFETPVRLIKK